MRNSRIEWCDDTWNPLRGCTRVSEGCRNCYAEVMAARFSGPGQAYEGLARMQGGDHRWTGKVALVEAVLVQPLRRRRPRRIFANSMSDLFHESVPDEWLDRIFAVMARAGQHTFQVLTKRPQRARDYLTAAAERCWGWEDPMFGGPLFDPFVSGSPLPLSNVWLGVSVEDRQTMLDRGAALKECSAAVRFWSFEPMLDRPGHIPLDIMPNWVIAGGESGPGARPMHPDWVRSLRDQCAIADVPFFFKQWGAWLPDRMLDNGVRRGCLLQSNGTTATMEKHGNAILNGTFDFGPWQHFSEVGKAAAGRALDGRTHDDFPEVPR